MGGSFRPVRALRPVPPTGMQTILAPSLRSNRLVAPALLLIAAFALPRAARAQTPTKCLEIESILVDACISTDCAGSSEGMNEMVRFITGPAPIATSALQFVFFSSNFLGIAQNPTTALLTAQLDASIQGCGRLLEPPAGIIPPGSRVIFVSSTAMCVQANPFTELNDTLYIIFQNPGNSQGHFKNNDLVGSPVTTVPNAPLPRWLRINVSGTGCGDTATYDANALVNIHGTYGGLNSENDGATVECSWPGTPVTTYLNHGCQAPFTPTLVSVPSGGGAILCGGSAHLVGHVTGDHVSVIWQGGGGTFSDPTAITTDYTPGGGDNGDVQLSFCAVTACGDTVCEQVTVTTEEMPEVSITGDLHLCGNFETTLLTAHGADSYQWSNGSTGPTTVVDMMGSGTVWVLGSTACGSDTASVVVEVMRVTGYYGSISCHGGDDGTFSLLASGGIGPYTYQWSTGSTDTIITGLSAGSITWTVVDAEGCTISGGYTHVDPPLLTAVVGSDTTICPGGYAVLNAQADGGTPGYTYTWSPEGPLVWPTSTATYSVMIADARGCTVGPLSMTVQVGSGTIAFASTDPEGCVPHCVTFTTDTTAGASYAWTFGDGSTGTDAVVEHCYTDPGTYSVSLTVDQADGCGGSTTMADLVQVHALPVADLSYSPEHPAVGEPVLFTDHSTDASAWAWQFGDPSGSTSTDASPAFLYPGSGCYPVVLTVSNGPECTDQAQALVCIATSDSLVVPNVFSPNGDGRNDAFRITGLREMDLVIYNRYGQLMTTLAHPRQSWDGRTGAGSVASEGTYFYVLHGIDHQGSTIDRSGSITLVR